MTATAGAAPAALRPATEAELAEAVAGHGAAQGGAQGARRGLEIRSGGTRGGLGRPVRAAAVLDVSGLSGIRLHDAGALTLVAGAGTPMAEIEAALAAERQRLAFEPMDHRALYGSAGSPSIGAVAAGNISGPRRIQAGACRDSLIGLRFVDGRGTVLRSGGRVMKNVTGYDLVKLLCGALGTLGVLTEVAFKLLPAPEAAATLALEGLETADAVAAMSAALGTPYEVTGAAHLPAAAADGTALTLLRIEGFEAQVGYRIGRLRERLPGDARVIEGAAHAALWRRVRDAEPFAAEPAADGAGDGGGDGGGDPRPVWRISVAPGDAPALVAALAARLGAETMLDWGGGLIWARLPASLPDASPASPASPDDSPDAHAAALRALLPARGGHATLVRAPAVLRAAAAVFQPEPPRLAALSASLRRAFDPEGILNPGRMAA
ncbi:glycolate oxidase subunit GlcE [Paralimibaculum aggregatum]|uniref:Glycolate oxidase subunit GlcE n=1 Tax=Paralimibaculum aggregatum TaxID=3036245 RepID=A0ABQ6LU89_9RHOB|nr:FAD-binding protein [Limibaculum sp. NKW23]GMG85645.1 glycolate oxidase subunit GlcE [Limibaculum sp. NKW23]